MSNQSNFSECLELDRNPAISTPGSIQPHGVLLAVNDRLEILLTSDNTQEHLNLNPEDLLGQSLSMVFDRANLKTIAQLVAENFDGVKSFRLSHRQNYLDGFLHKLASVSIIELLPADPKEVNFLDVHNHLREAIAKLKSTRNRTEFLQIATESIRKITDFERVMVYEFDQYGAGSVIAEAKQEPLSPYLGLHYPATDIPNESRSLYKHNPLRYLPYLIAEPSKLLCAHNCPTDINPLDLSLSILRSVHPCCVEFHQNMDVAALLVIPLHSGEELWGLISCHHSTPKQLSYEVRTGCEFLGQYVSAELANKIIEEEVEYKTKLSSLRSMVVESISVADNFTTALINPEMHLVDLVGATGVAVCLDREITLLGDTPNQKDVRSLIEWAALQARDNLFYTNSLPSLYPEALSFKDTASGLLMLVISQVRRYYILWFKKEIIQTVNWAGNPKSALQIRPDGSNGPRNSFARWQEIVRSTSSPWKTCELENALSLRNAIVGIVLKKADELAKINQELERSNQELASFAYAASHDLKEPLRGIYNFSTVLLEDYANLLDEDGVEYLYTVVSLSLRMETLINALLRLSQLGQAEVHLQTIDLNELLTEIVDIFRASRGTAALDIRIPKALPLVQCDPVLVNELFSNLIGNALKYNDKAQQWVEIGYLDADEQLSLGLLQSPAQPDKSKLFYVRDNGIGIPEHHHKTIFRLFKRLHSQEKYGGGAGAGLSICKKIVERHGGQLWVESVCGKGSTFYFTL